MRINYDHIASFSALPPYKQVNELAIAIIAGNTSEGEFNVRLAIYAKNAGLDGQWARHNVKERVNYYIEQNCNKYNV